MRWLIAVVVCSATVAGCGVLSGTDGPSVGTADPTTPTTGFTATTDSVTGTTTAVPPFWVVQKSQDRLSQTLAYNHPELGPSTIWISYGSVPSLGGRLGVSVTATVDGSIYTMLDWSAPADVYDVFEFAGAPQFESVRQASVVPSPVDGLGHVFFDWGDSQLSGVSYLVPTATGFDDLGTFTDPLTTGVYGATVDDIDEDGVYEIVQAAEGCAPDCPLPGETIIYAWNGSSYAATEAPSTTAPTTTPPPTQPPAVPPPTAPPPPRTDPPDPGPNYGFFDAPQLGAEPVRGSGCGGDGTLGDVIPDGWWYGISSPWGPSSFEFDIVCIYYGESARPHVTACTSSPRPDLCLTYFSEDFWMVNNNDRTRTVPLSTTIEVRNPGVDYCADWDVRSAGNLSLIHIVGGRAVSLETRCPSG